MTDAKINSSGMVGLYKSAISPLDNTSERYYPVRVYDGKGKLKYELNRAEVKAYASKKLGAGEHWKTTKPYYNNKNK